MFVYLCKIQMQSEVYAFKQPLTAPFIIDDTYLIDEFPYITEKYDAATCAIYGEIQVNPELRHTFASVAEHTVNISQFSEQFNVQFTKEDDLGWSLLQYTPGCKFEPHTDTGEYTLLLFPSRRINADIIGGMLNIYDSHPSRYNDTPIMRIMINIQAGEFDTATLLIINKQVLHEVSKLLSGVRYVFKKNVFRSPLHPYVSPFIENKWQCDQCRTVLYGAEYHKLLVRYQLIGLQICNVREYPSLTSDIINRVCEYYVIEVEPNANVNGFYKLAYNRGYVLICNEKRPEWHWDPYTGTLRTNFMLNTTEEITLGLEDGACDIIRTAQHRRELYNKWCSIM